jgi:transcriptional regulator with XRE-family HTH domain
MSISDQKREFLKQSVKTLKKERGLTQRRIAEDMGEDEGAFSGKLGGSRGITDDYLDKFGELYGLHFLASAAGTPPGTITIDAKVFSDLVEQVKTQTRLLNAVLDRMEGK